MEAQGIDGAWAVTLLNLPAGIVLIVPVLWHWSRHRPYLKQALAIGLFTGFALALYGIGIAYTSVVRATMLFYLTPVWATLIGIFWLGERAVWQRWVAIGSGLAGLALLLSGGSTVPLSIGDLYAILSGVVWAIGAAMIMRFEGVPLPSMLSAQFFFTAIAAFILGGIAGAVEIPELDQLRTVAPMSVGISLLAFVPAVGVLFWAQKFLFPGRVGLLMMSEAMTAVVTASIFLPEERMSVIAWIGAALIVGACLLEVLLSPSEPEGEKG